MSNIAIIGSGHGDEGKGHATDYFSSPCSLVIRYNAGPQAGHTVVTDSFRQVFHHFGSGTLSGSPTYLSRYFICNPILFIKELDELKDFNPIVYISPDALVTTPYDMILNDIIEKSRGINRHGSCGCGINETVERNIILDELRVKDINKKDFKDRLEYVRKVYVYERLTGSFGIDPDLILEKHKKLLLSEGLLNHFLSDCELFLKHSRRKIDLKDFSSLIFEGAQGLLLDQDNKTYFPHVTRSNTGIKNVISIMEEFNITSSIDIYYITRAYLTRHGPGKFPTEVESKPFKKVEDFTNVENEFQGALRFGYLDVNQLNEAINNDLLIAKNIQYSKNLVITCLDQCDEESILVHNKEKIICSDIADFLVSELKPRTTLLSFGPKKNNIKKK
jgi:adenylosuccinate synthase